jgi:hypothetical protein
MNFIMVTDKPYPIISQAWKKDDCPGCTVLFVSMFLYVYKYIYASAWKKQFLTTTEFMYGNVSCVEMEK